MKPAIERALLGQLREQHAQINRTQFRGALRPVTLALIDSAVVLGQWVPRSRTIRLSRELLRQYDWTAILEVLRHEMAHQYVSEVLKVSDETAHGAAFQRVCREYGVDAAATGAPRGNDGPEDRIVQRIRHLLALAESPNEHEAQLAARKAYTLMLKHNIQRVDSVQPDFVVQQVGPVTLRMSAHIKALAGLLGEHFFVYPVFTPVVDTETGEAAKALRLHGRPDNVAMAEHVFTWMLETGERLFTEWKRAHNTRSNAERRRFLAGLVHGFHQQLSDQRRTVQETGLVWVGDPGLDRFVRRRYPRLRSGRRTSIRNTQAFRSGVNQGRRLELHRPVKAGPSGGVRALTDRKKR